MAAQRDCGKQPDDADDEDDGFDDPRAGVEASEWGVVLLEGGVEQDGYRDDGDGVDEQKDCPENDAVLACRIGSKRMNPTEDEAVARMNSAPAIRSVLLVFMMSPFVAQPSRSESMPS